MADCDKCTHKQIHTVIHVEDESGATAPIKTRGGFYLDTTAGLNYITPAGRYEFAFSVLNLILQAEQFAAFYFVEAKDRELFLTEYPGYASWNI